MKTRLSNPWDGKRFRLALSVFSLCLFSLLSSCSQEEEVSAKSSQPDEPIHFTTWSMTRFADEGLFSPGDSVGIYSVKWLDNTTPDILLPAGNHRDNVPYSLEDENDNWTSPDPIYYPFGGRNIDLFAYYPYQEQMFNADTRLNVAVAADQSALEDYRKSDFKAAVARGQNASNAPIHFDFYHRLSQVTFELIAGTGVMPEELLVAEIKLKNVVTDGTYSFTGGTPDSVYLGSSMADVVPCGSWDIVEGKVVGQAALVMPQLLTANSILEVTVENTVVSAPFEEAVQLRSGESRVISITLTGQGIEFETEIKPWDEQPPVGGDGALIRFKPQDNYADFTLAVKSGVRMDWGDGSPENIFTAAAPTYNHRYVSLGDYAGRAYGESNAINKIRAGRLKELDIRNCPEITELKLGEVSLETIDISRNSKLETIDWFIRELSSLDLSRNPLLTYVKIWNPYETLPLSELDLSNNTQVKYLYLSATSISEIDLSHTPELEELHCMHSRLSEIGLSNSPSLQTLNIENNNISVLDVSNNTLLDTLQCGTNPISALDLSSNTLIEFLECSHNHLTDLDLSGNTSLTYLECNYNFISELDLSQNTSVESVYCRNNRLSGLDLTNNPSLSILNCSNNSITELLFPDNSKLTNLYCAGNRLQRLDISDNPELYFIDCGGNPFLNSKMECLDFILSLPSRGTLSQGTLQVDAGLVDTIQQLCAQNGKNWIVKATTL